MSGRTIQRVVIRGRVQGVGFRYWTEDTAGAHGVEGWVRNRRDGTVEAVFTGPETAVRAMIDACRSGPPGSRVDAIEEREGSAEDLALRRGQRFAVLETV